MSTGATPGTKLGYAESGKTVSDRGQRQLETLLGNLPGMAYRRVNAPGWPYEHVSDGCFAITGHRPDDFVSGRVHLSSLIHPDDRERVTGEIDRAMRSATPYVVEYRVIAADGALRWVWEKGVAVRGHGGDIEALEGFISDVTERRQAEMALRERVKEMRCLFEVTEILDPDWPLEDSLRRLVDRIPPAYRWPSQVAARVTLDGEIYQSPGFREGPCCQRAAIVAGGVEIGAVEVSRRSGEDCADYFLPEEQKLLDTIADRLRVYLDRRRYESALRASEERARAMFEHLPTATFVWQRFEDDFVLASWNAAAADMAGEGIERFAGVAASEMYAERPDIRDDMHACFERREIISREIDYSYHEGRTQHLLVTYGYAPPDMVMIYAEDLTERRHIEEQLRGAQKLEAIGRLAGGVAHDFNNILTVINSYADFALADLGQGHALYDDINQIRKAGERAAGLTRQLLAFSRRQILEPRVLELNTVVTDMRKMLERLLGEDIVLTTDLHEEIGSVRVDPGQMGQVIMNLAVNARDAMPRGGTLTIETHRQTLPEGDPRHGIEPGDYVILTMTDTGCGMDQATAARLFEPFFTTKGPGQGTGLGLSTVHGIVAQSGGTITVDSEPGRGATFTIYLPREKDAGAPEPVRGGVHASAAGSERVLLVEDEAGVRTLAQRILAGAGYQVVAAASGNEAMAALDAEASAFDLLLTDVVMPGMSGRDLAIQIAARSPSTKVLYMSGHADNALGHHGVLTPGTHFLGKPFTAFELTRRVRAVLDE